MDVMTLFWWRARSIAIWLCKMMKGMSPSGHFSRPSHSHFNHDLSLSTHFTDTKTPKLWWALWPVIGQWSASNVCISAYSVVQPLAWAGCALRLGRIQNVAKHTANPNRKHKANDNNHRMAKSACTWCLHCCWYGLAASVGIWIKWVKRKPNQTRSWQIKRPPPFELKWGLLHLSNSKI
jgi:hypothetical protein